MTLDQIRRCSKFRSRERLPALTFAFKNTTGVAEVGGAEKANKVIPTTMWRCSQCKTGFTSRSADDELMLRLIGDPSCKEFRSTIVFMIHLLTVYHTIGRLIFVSGERAHL